MSSAGAASEQNAMPISGAHVAVLGPAVEAGGFSEVAAHGRHHVVIVGGGVVHSAAVHEDLQVRRGHDLEKALHLRDSARRRCGTPRHSSAAPSMNVLPRPAASMASPSAPPKHVQWAVLSRPLPSGTPHDHNTVLSRRRGPPPRVELVTAKHAHTPGVGGLSAGGGGAGMY